MMNSLITLTKDPLPKNSCNNMAIKACLSQLELKPEPIRRIRMEFQVYFGSGDDRLSAPDHARVIMLAEYLRRHPELKAHLIGYADWRGTDEYNNLLAGYRVQSVANALLARAIDSERLLVESVGALRAHALLGASSEDSLYRRVTVEVFHEPIGC